MEGAMGTRKTGNIPETKLPDATRLRVILHGFHSRVYPAKLGTFTRRSRLSLR